MMIKRQYITASAVTTLKTIVVVVVFQLQKKNKDISECREIKNSSNQYVHRW